jgi:hypothetical protein
MTFSTYLRVLMAFVTKIYFLNFQKEFINSSDAFPQNFSSIFTKFIVLFDLNKVESIKKKKQNSVDTNE